MSALDRTGAAAAPIKAEFAKGDTAWSSASYFLTTVLLLLPFPFGGWSIWASSLLATVVGLALCAIGVAVLLGRNSLNIRAGLYSVPLVMFVIVLLWVCFQASSWTPEALHHPLWGAAAASLRAPFAGTISLDPAATRRVGFELATYGAVFWISMQCAARPKLALLFMQAVALSTTIYSVYGISIYLAHSNTVLWFEKTVYLNDVTATFDNHNNFAAFAGMGLIVSIGLMLKQLAALSDADEFASRSLLVKFEHFWKKAWPYIVAAVVLATAVLLSASRAGMITVLSGILALFFILRRSRELRLIKSGWLFAVTGILLVALLLFSGHNTLARFDVRLIEEEPRIPAYLAALDAVRAHPWLGSGLGAFEPAFRIFRTFGVEGRFMEAHSDILENVVELGMPAAILLDATVLVILMACGAGARTRRRGAIFPAIATAVTVQIGTHAFVDFNLQVPAVVVSYAIVLASGFAQSFRSADIGQSVGTVGEAVIRVPAAGTDLTKQQELGRSDGPKLL